MITAWLLTFQLIAGPVGQLGPLTEALCKQMAEAAFAAQTVAWAACVPVEAPARLVEQGLAP